MATNSKTANVNVTALLTLAQLSSDLDDGLDVLTSMQNTSVAGAALAVALKRKQEKSREEAVEKAADAVIELIAASDNKIIALRGEYRRLRAMMRVMKNEMTDIAVARMHGEETMNFLPLQVVLGGVKCVDENHKELLEVSAAKREEYLKKLKLKITE